MNRKLIRTTLAEVKGKAREVPQPRERSNGGSHRGRVATVEENADRRVPLINRVAVQVAQANAATDGNQRGTLLLQEADRRAHTHGYRLA